MSYQLKDTNIFVAQKKLLTIEIEDLQKKIEKLEEKCNNLVKELNDTKISY